MFSRLSFVAIKTTKLVAKSNVKHFHNGLIAKSNFQVQASVTSNFMK
jgi:hypothetical protein